jgi:hypothetical protein
MKALSIFIACATLLAGCTSFEPLRSNRFVDDYNNYLHVDYGRDTKDHESVAILSNGVRWPFKSKYMVRVELPDGTSFVAYQNLAPAGNLYKTEDEEWEFFESGGAGCLVAQLDKDRSGYITRFRGTLCATVRNPANVTRERIRSGGSTPHGFGRDVSGSRDMTDEKGK